MYSIFALSWHLKNLMDTTSTNTTTKHDNHLSTTLYDNLEY